MQNINTAYDDVFHTLMHDCPCLIIPIVNEIFDEDYTGQETIELSQNELYFQQADGTEAERITDSSFVIEKPGGWKKRYHLECQSTPDGSMVIRMFEYDSLIAIHNGEQTIIAMTEMVVNSLARKYEVIARGVADSMGGKILEYEAKDILKRGKDEGIQLGRKEGLKDGHTAGVNEKTRTIVSNMLKRNMPDADICALAECSQELVDEIKNNLK